MIRSNSEARQRRLSMPKQEKQRARRARMQAVCLAMVEAGMSFAYNANTYRLHPTHGPVAFVTYDPSRCGFWVGTVNPVGRQDGFGVHDSSDRIFLLPTIMRVVKMATVLGQVPSRTSPSQGERCPTTC